MTTTYQPPIYLPQSREAEVTFPCCTESHLVLQGLAHSLLKPVPDFLNTAMPWMRPLAIHLWRFLLRSPRPRFLTPLYLKGLNHHFLQILYNLKLHPLVHTAPPAVISPQRVPARKLIQAHIYVYAPSQCRQSAARR